MLKYLGVGSAAAVAGCTDGGGDDETTTTEDTGDGGETTETTTQTTQEEFDRAVGGTFTFASTSTSGAPNPLRVEDTTTDARLNKLYDYPGSELGPETFQPLLFGDMSINDSFDVVEYTLRDGLMFGAGYGQLTADDYMTLLNEIVLNTGDDDWYGFTDTQFYRVGPDQELISYEKVDDLTIRAELPVSKPQWLHEDPFTTQYPVPEDLIMEYAPDEDVEGLDSDPAFAEGQLATGDHNLGPYNFEAWERGSQWQFSRNEDYYLQEHADEDVWSTDPYYDYSESPYFEEYRYQQFDESQTAQSALEAGEVEAASIPSRDVSKFRGVDDITLWESKFDNGVFWLNINHRANSWAPLRESREVRYAMANLYDKQTVIQNVYQGNAVPLSTFHPSWGPFYPSEDDLFTPEGSVERAKELLEEGTSSEYGYDESGNFIGPEGEQVTLSTVRTTGNPATEVAANYMQQRLEEAGIQMEIDAQQWQSLLLNYAMNSHENVEDVSEDDLDWGPIGSFNGGPWDQATSSEDWSLMFGLGFSTSPYAPWSAVKSTMAEQGTFNLWGYSQDEFDIISTIDEASTASDSNVTQQNLTELFGFLSRDMPVVWTNSGYNVYGYSDDIVGFPGDETDDGYKATSYFRDVSSSRLMSFRPE